MRHTEKELENQIQVKEVKNGETEVFTFEMPKGELKPKHINAFLKFLRQNQISEVMKSLLHIYFTARDDEYFEMNSDERICFEHTLTLLADLTCENVNSFRVD